MSSPQLYPTVIFQPSETNDDANDSSLAVDEGAILLKHQVNEPREGENMTAAPSLNSEAYKNRMRDGNSMVDMVLTYALPDPAKIDTDKEIQTEEDRKAKREFYLDGLKKAGLVTEIEQLGGGSEVCELVHFDTKLLI